MQIKLVGATLLTISVLTAAGLGLKYYRQNAAKPEEPVTVEELVSDMTLEEKVGQLFIVRPEALSEIGLDASHSGGSAEELTPAIKNGLSLCPVGGISMFGANITSPEQITEFIKDLQSASDIPLFIAVDEEGGAVARLANKDAFGLIRYESPAAVAESGDPADALEMGRTIGGYLSEYGFNLDFAPVADVNTNPDNPVIGARSFSPDPNVAAEMASSMAQGLRENGIIPTFKHFPGHGDTSEDSHISTAVSRKTEEEMMSCEWLPFMEALDTDCIMVGHITAPELDEDLIPASLSHKIVTDILRGTLGFKGLIITDALEMGAITEEYGSGGAAVAAFNAGCDILLIPGDLEEAYNAVLEAAKSGEISAERLDESVTRILEFKEKYFGLN